MIFAFEGFRAQHFCASTHLAAHESRPVPACSAFRQALLCCGGGNLKLPGSFFNVAGKSTPLDEYYCRLHASSKRTASALHQQLQLATCI